MVQELNKIRILITTMASPPLRVAVIYPEIMGLTTGIELVSIFDELDRLPSLDEQERGYRLWDIYNKVQKMCSCIESFIANDLIDLNEEEILEYIYTYVLDSLVEISEGQRYPVYIATLFYLYRVLEVIQPLLDQKVEIPLYFYPVDIKAPYTRHIVFLQNLAIFGIYPDQECTIGDPDVYILVKKVGDNKVKIRYHFFSGQEGDSKGLIEQLQRERPGYSDVIVPIYRYFDDRKSTPFIRLPETTTN